MSDEERARVEAENSELESQVEVAYNDYAAYRSRLEAKEAELEEAEQHE